MADSPIGGPPTARDAEALKASISRMNNGYRFAVVQTCSGRDKRTGQRVARPVIVAEMSEAAQVANYVRRDPLALKRCRFYKLADDGWKRVDPTPYGPDEEVPE